MESSTRRPTQVFNIGSYLEPDVLTSFEYSKTFRRRDHLLPEVRLMFAVLINAIECLQKYSGGKSRRCQKISAEAEEWVLDAESRMLYSFEHVCEVLQLDPSYLRKGLMRWLADFQKIGSDSPQRRIREPLRYQRRLRDTRITA